MNESQQAELAFWKSIYEYYGEKYLAFREGDMGWYASGFWDLDLKGKGLEVGTGMFSMLAFSDADVVGIDPLQKEFQAIFPYPQSRVEHLVGDGECLLFGDESFDWVVYWNVIDHTPNPHLMSQEIARVLKPGGKLYLEVNFDEVLTPEHYGLWDEARVEEVLGNFTETYRHYEYNKPMRRRSFFGIFEKAAER